MTALNSASIRRNEFRSSAGPRASPTVFVVDDDESVRESLESLIRSAGWKAEVFESAQEFLSRPSLLSPTCLVLDVTLPGLTVFDQTNRRRSTVERHPRRTVTQQYCRKAGGGDVRYTYKLRDSETS